jgi:hypothetical protein
VTNQFCHFLSNGYTLNVINDQLTTRPCCVYPKHIPLKDSIIIRQELEYTSNASDWIPECSECKRIESIGVGSIRTLSKERVVGNFAPGDCVSLEVNFDKKCNAACLSCASDFSSTWERYNRKHNLEDKIARRSASDMFKQFVKTVPLDKLQFLYIQGGEPFYGSTNLKFLKHIFDVHPNPAGITLHYQTNGSILPSDEVLNLWTQFKTVVLNYSIDDIEDRFHYLRWPLDWSTLTSNIKRIIETTNVNFQVNSTINPLNILNYNNLESWIVSTFPSDRLLKYRAGACLGNLDLRHSPIELRQAVVTKYGKDHKVSKLFNTRELFDQTSMINYIAQHDQFRRLDWRKTFPESVPFLGKVYD